MVVKEANKDSEKTKVLKEALTSDECKKFIEEKYKGVCNPGILINEGFQANKSLTVLFFNF